MRRWGSSEVSIPPLDPRSRRPSRRAAAVCAAHLLAPGTLAAQGEQPHAAPQERAQAGAADHSDASDFVTPHYDEGFVLVEPRDPDKVPYRLKLNHVSQFKYSNSLAVNHTYTDHLGRVKDVQRWQTLVTTTLAAGVSAILWVVLISGADWLLR